MSEPQRKNIARLLNKLTDTAPYAYLSEREQRLAFISDVINRPIDTTNDLGKREAIGLISELKRLAGEEDKPQSPRVPTTNEEPPPREPDASYSDYDESPF
jgi:hypothetical protein